MGFSEGFLWGAASAAYQLEGAWNEDGKAPGIWDALSENRIKYGENGNSSADHYHHYKEDVALMKQIGLKSYRFSISWPRVITARGCINEKGLEFYSNLVDELKCAGIEPLVTLYHWDMPMWVHEYGGWENPQIIQDFADYTEIVVKTISDRVRYWMTINEPQSFVGAGYSAGIHAPFIQREDVRPIVRNVLVAHGRSVQIIRKYAKLQPMIGFAPTGTGIIPQEESEESIEKARTLTYSEYSHGGIGSNIWWMDPVYLGEIPDKLQNVISQDDLTVIHQPLDFCGVNIYNAENQTLAALGDFPDFYSGMPRNALGWPITQDVLYWMSRFHYERYRLPIMIMENGMPNNDFVMLDGKVHDPQRIDYIHRYLGGLKRAVGEGIPIEGYQYWSIMDNLEWAEGYDPRFGLIYVDYRTKERILKDSAYDYAEIIRTNGASI